MRRPAAARRVVALAVLASLLAGCAGSVETPPTSSRTNASGAPAIALEEYLTGFDAPVFMETVAGLGTVVIEQGGLVRVQAGDGPRVTLLDVSDEIVAGGEQGLLGFAAHPRYEEGDRRFYLDFTDTEGDTRIVEYIVAAAESWPPSVIEARTLLLIPQPYANHNGGMLAFGPDGMLYIGMGDGGSAGDPQGNGQDKHALLGKILRIDVGSHADAIGRAPYKTTGNPFSGAEGAREVWDYGLRNPWRFSFDRATGDLWIGDVGQDGWEEVNHVPAGKGGNNFGWAHWEGRHLFDADVRTDGEVVMPVAEYYHSEGRKSVTGGYVYRGSEFPSLAGTYLYGDFYSGTLWGLDADDPTAVPQILLESGKNVASFAEDDDGGLYLVHYGGTIYRIVAQ